MGHFIVEERWILQGEIISSEYVIAKIIVRDIYSID